MPLIKNKKGNEFSSENYQPIMKSSNILKIIEFHLLGIIEEKFSLNSCQFGFSKGYSTTDACFLLKEIVSRNYSKKGSLCTFHRFVESF